LEKTKGQKKTLATEGTQDTETPKRHWQQRAHKTQKPSKKDIGNRGHTRHRNPPKKTLATEGTQDTETTPKKHNTES
jgi:hypothetical protein